MDESAARNKQRAECYRLLAACYCMPGKEFIEEGLAGNLAEALETVCPDAIPYAKEMVKALDGYDFSSPKNDILIDFSALFVGPFALLAAPYGSVYLEKEKARLMGDSTIDAVKTYRSAGVKMDNSQDDMPDHISVEMEFIYYLLNREDEAGKAGNKEEADRFRQIRENFMERHLGAWAFDFTKKMREAAKTSFYSGLADCTTAFLRSEMNGRGPGQSAGEIAAE